MPPSSSLSTSLSAIPVNIPAAPDQRRPPQARPSNARPRDSLRPRPKSLQIFSPSPTAAGSSPRRGPTPIRRRPRPARKRISRANCVGCSRRTPRLPPPLRFLQRSPFLFQPFNRTPAYIAGLTRFPLRILAKMLANLPMPAIRRLHKSLDRVVPIPRPIHFPLIAQLPDKMRQQSHIAFAPQQNTIRG